MMPVYEIALFTDRGRVRENNEDAVFAGGKIFQEDLRDVVSMRLTGTPHALLVADGIGGRPQGERASRSVLHFLTSDHRLVQDVDGCAAALHSANERLYELMVSIDVHNFDPFERRGLAVALVSSELAGIAETRRARVV
jgi:serine/threonine protein phosphatase PrpC